MILHFTPSQKKILSALADLGRATKKDLVTKVGLPRRTIYQAIRTMPANLIHEAPSLKDTRQSFFSLTEKARTEGWN